MIKKADGFVSLFTAIIISLLLIVIVLSMVGLETLQLRKAEDAEQSLRAYYTAEAGVENAVSKVLDNQISPGHGDNACNPNGVSGINYDIPGDSGWTCQDVSFNGSPTGKLQYSDYAVQIAPGHIAGGYKELVFQWDQTTGNAGRYNVPAGNLPQEDGPTGYIAKYNAPPLEVAIVEYPNGGFNQSQFASGVVKLDNVLFVPGGNTPAATIADNALDPVAPVRANCKPGGNKPAGYVELTNDYNCYAILTNINPGHDYIFRIRTRYLPTNYSMSFYKAPNNYVEVPTGTATIDVTARAGQSYRRVISLLPLGQGAAAGLNFVMYSDQNICKDFDVINNQAVTPTACPGNF